MTIPATISAKATTGPADAAERAAALEPTRSFLVEAPAGSGKTGLLVQRLLTLLPLVDEPEAVLALTFTNKATAEMRERVLRALELPAKDIATLSNFEQELRTLAASVLQHDRLRGWDLQRNSHRFNIRTIDSLCGEIARSLPLLSGAVGHMSPVPDSRPLYTRAARAVTLRLGGSDPVLNDALRTVLLRRDADIHNAESLLANMLGTREQWARLIPLSPAELTDDFLDREVKPKLDRTLQSVVCAALARLEQVFPAPELHALTELAASLSTEPGHGDAPNPYAACSALTSVPGSRAVDLEHWVMLAKLLLTKDGWRKGLAANHLGVALASAQRKQLRSLIDSISTNDALFEQLCQVRDLPPTSMPADDWHVTKALFQLLHYALLELEGIFRAGDRCDFTEHSLAAREALRPDPVTGASRPLESLRHLLVDEMQDTSSAQYDLLESLTAGWNGTDRTVFLVGDPKQSIYLFRQARVERFVGSLHSGRLGSVPLTTLRLTTNFRSAAPLVEECNRLFAPIFAADSSGGIPFSPAVAARSSEPGHLQWHIDPLWGDYGTPERRQSRFRVRREQATHIVQTIYRLRTDAPPGKPPSIAVLVRAREHAAPITRCLRESGIPFRGVDLEPLYERPEILESLALTRALLHPADRVAWLAVLRAPWCGVTLADLHHLADAERRGSRTRAPRRLFRERATDLPLPAQQRVLRTLDVLDEAAGTVGRMPVSQIVDRASRALGADLFRNESERTNVRRFLELLEEAEAELRPLDANDLEARLAQLYAEPGTTPGAVEIMTIHKAKGLEWDVVFVPELQRASAFNGYRLLDWLEVAAGSTQEGGLLLAPIPQRGSRAAELSRYVQNASRAQSEAELARLFYVVATRARSQLHLYAAPELKKDTGEVASRAGTLLKTAWPAAGTLIQDEANARQKSPGELSLLQGSAHEADTPDRELADLRRVPDGFQPGTLQPPLVLPWLHGTAAPAHSASEQPNPPQSSPEHPVIDQSSPDQPSPDQPNLEQLDRPEASLASRALGTAVHLFLDGLARRLGSPNPPTVPQLLAEIERWPSRIHSTLRSLGASGAALDRGVATVLRALRNTIDTPDALWLLQPHPGAASEQLLTVPGEPDTPTRSLRMDRSFFAGNVPGSTAPGGNSTLWIVDYKTATPVNGAGDARGRNGSPASLPLFDNPAEDFLAEQRKLYAPQLRNYARAAAANLTAAARAQTADPPKTAIMLALYYPLLPALDFWPWDPAQPD